MYLLTTYLALCVLTFQTVHAEQCVLSNVYLNSMNTDNEKILILAGVLFVLIPTSFGSALWPLPSDSPRVARRSCHSCHRQEARN